MVEDATERTLRDGQPEAAPSSDMRLAGRYRLRGILGRGGMGTVYRAEDMELGELIALKIVAKATASAENAERHRDEVRLARRVTHPNVARTFDMGEHGHLRFITMELVRGVSLRDVIASDTPLDGRLVLVGHVALGLAAIHDAGIAHRDLKPENVLVSASGIAKITDFGIARSSDALTAGMTTGTPKYMAPEVLAGAPPTKAADIYAFGLVAVELITGEQFPGGDLRPLERELERVLGKAHRAIPFFLQCLASAPAARPNSTHAVGELLSAGRAPSMDTLPPSSTARVRICASVFVADPGDAWLADSIPTHILRGLSSSPDLQVMSTLVPAEEATRATLERAADVVLQGSVQRATDGLRIAVRAVATDDQLTLWARTEVIPMSVMSSRLGDVVSEIRLAVTDQARTRVTIGEEDPRVTELLFRAAHEENDPWRDFSTAAADLLEEARQLAPDDPNVLASLAIALLQGGGAFDATRFEKARSHAQRAVERDGASPEAQHALAVTLFLSNDLLGAVDSLRAVLRAMPSLGDAHGMVGAIATDVGLFGDAIGRASLALAMDPAFSISRLVLALARQLSGDRQGADRTVDEGLATSSVLARVLSALAGARLAMWRGTAADIDAFVDRILRVEGLPFVEPLIGVLQKRLSIDEVLSALGPFGAVSPEWGRHYCIRWMFEVELAVHTEDLPRAISCVERLVAAGSHDDAWISQSPMARRLPDVPAIRSARDVIARRAQAVRRKLTESGLVGSPRARMRRP